MKKPIQLRAVEIPHRIKIETREGALYGEKGDFLLEGIDFEVYPIGRDIFYRTYDILENDFYPDPKKLQELRKKPDEERLEKHKENVERVVNDKEEVVLAQIVKKDGKIGIKHSKSAQQFEVFGFLTVYLEAEAQHMINQLESNDEFELY